MRTDENVVHSTLYDMRLQIRCNFSSKTTGTCTKDKFIDQGCLSQSYAMRHMTS